MNVYQIMEEILNVVESSKEELVNKYVPNMKAERRHLDKETKKGKKLAKGLDMSADVSADMAKIAKKDVDKAEDNLFNVMTNPNHTDAEYFKASKERNEARKEMGEWRRDEQKTRKEAEETKVKAKEANKKRNELNRKIAALKGRSDVVTDKAFEALEIMEEIMNTIDEGKYSKEDLKAVANKVYDKRAKELHKSVNRLSDLHKKAKELQGREATGDDIRNYQNVVKGVKRAQNRLQHAKDVAELTDREAIVRHNIAFEALELMEAIINEVSMKGWTETAQEVLPQRKKEFKSKEKAYIKSIGGNENNPEETWDKLNKSAGYPENREYKELKDAAERVEHAQEVSKLNKGSGSVSANKVITAANKSVDSRHKENENSDRTSRAADLGNADPVKSKVWKRANEALSLMEQICDFADNLFELDYEEKQNISPNKISKVKKGKDGEKVEVVSVADELFPYEGDAKQQFNQKILAKINDMIEGTGTLEDLIQFVRKGVANKKLTHESTISERKNIFGHEEGNRGDLIDDVSQTVTGKTLNQHIENKVVKPVKRVEEALDLMEEIINELNDEVKVKTGIKRLENARKAYQDFKDSGKNLDNAKKEWQQARDKYSALRAEKKMKVGDSLRAEGEFRDKYFQANKDFYQKHDDAQAANNKLKRFSKVQNIKNSKAASDLKQEVDKFRQENK